MNRTEQTVPKEGALHEIAEVGFRSAVAFFESGRPDYAQDAISELVQLAELVPGKSVLELGAGTGKFTRLVAKPGISWTAIEPLQEMREEFQARLPGISVLPGVAEKIPAGDSQFDVVVAAQSFHWFDSSLALPEISRVLKPRGILAMLWNRRNEEVSWVAALGEILEPFERSAPIHTHRAWKEAIDQSGLFTEIDHSDFYHFQKATPRQIIDYVASISYIAALEESARQEVLGRVEGLLANEPATRGRELIDLPFRTDLYWCRRV